MSVDYGITAGIGIHVAPSLFNRWLEDNDPDEAGGYEAAYDLAEKYPGVSFDWVGNAWTGIEKGYVFWASSTTVSVDETSGVFPITGSSISLKVRGHLQEIGKLFNEGEELPIQPLLAISVS
jgi:hypothetical protein